MNTYKVIYRYRSSDKHCTASMYAWSEDDVRRLCKLMYYPIIISITKS